MISINKQGNAIRIDFTDNDKYLFNGTMEVAPNELMLVVDESDMITFKRTTNGDVLFSQIVDNIRIDGSAVTKDNVIEQFATIGYNSVTSVNGQTGAVVLTADSLDAYTKYEVDEKFATKEQMSGKQDKLVSGTNIKTVNGESILGSGNIVIQSGASNWDDIQGKPQFAGVATSGDYNDLINKPTIPDISGLATKQEIADMETKSNAAATYATKEEIPSLEGYLTETGASETYATKQEMAGKQDTLVSGTNIKTINGDSILGEGNIEITSGGTVDTEMSDTSENAVQNKVIKQYVDTASSEFSNWKNGQSIVAGQNSNSTGEYAVTIGGETENTTAIGVVIGYGAKAKAGWPVIIGKDCIASNDTFAHNVLIDSMSTSGSNNVLIAGGTGFMSRGNNQVIINTLRGYETDCKYNDIVSINAAYVAKSNNQVNILATGGASDSVAIGLLSDDNIALRIGKDGKAYIYNNGVEVAIQDTINKVNTEITELIASKANSADVYTKSESDAKYLTEHQSLENYATKSEIPTATSQLTNDSGFITEIPSEYITETELSSSLNSKADSANVYTKAEIDNMIGEISARLDQINGEVV